MWEALKEGFWNGIYVAGYVLAQAFWCCAMLVDVFICYVAVFEIALWVGALLK